MANSLTNLLPKILAMGLDVLAENAVISRLVNTDWSEETAKKGAKISIPIYADSTVSDVVPGPVPPAVSTDVAPTLVEVELSNWKRVDFALSDKEIAEVMEGVVPKQLRSAAKAMGNAITNTVYANYKKISGFAGTSGTTPFDTTVAAATDARKILNKQLAPMEDRRMILDPDAAAKALGLSAFNNNAGTQEKAVLIEGQLGRKLGFDTYEDQLVPTHTTNATGAGALTVNGVHAIGATTLSVAKGAGANWSALKGDIITIAGDSTSGYALAADVTVVQATNTNVTLVSGLKKATVGAEAITVKASHVVNLAFNKYAFALAVRQLEMPVADLGPKVFIMTDARTGISMRLIVSQEHFRTRWSFDTLWGTECVRPELGCRIAG